MESSRKRPRTWTRKPQGDARTKKHADVWNGYLPTELANTELAKKEERKVVLQLVVRVRVH